MKTRTGIMNIRTVKLGPDRGEAAWIMLDKRTRESLKVEARDCVLVTANGITRGALVLKCVKKFVGVGGIASKRLCSELNLTDRQEITVMKLADGKLAKFAETN